MNANENAENELMARMKVSKAVATMAIPSVISSLVTVVYNMADTFFVGQTGDPLQVAAVSLTNPIFILFMAFANMWHGRQCCGIYGTWRAESEAYETGFCVYHVCVIGRWDSLRTCVSGIYAANPEYFWCQ